MAKKLSKKDQIAKAVSETEFSLEIHDIKSLQDGYNLRMHRISLEPFEISGPKQSILMLHGLLANGAQYVVHPEHESMAFKLARAGYDVWILHARGSRHSMKAQPKKNSIKKFWNFSFHEFGYFDLPAAIDHILQTTNQQMIHYIGHSQGCNAVLVTLSTRPEYNSKLKSAYLLTPGAILTSDRKLKPIRRFLSLGFKKITFKNLAWDLITVPVCKFRALNRVALNPTIKFIGNVSDSLDVYEFGNWLFTNLRDTASVKQLVHLRQLLDSRRFQMFDYGASNMQIYGTQSPPEYDLSLIEVPVTLMSADRDALVSAKDIEILETRLKNVRKNWMVSGNHLDFMFDTSVIKEIVDDILISLNNPTTVINQN